MAKYIRNITLGVIDSDGDGVAETLSVSYAISDDVDLSYRSRGSYIVTSPDFNQSMADAMLEAEAQIVIIEDIPSSSSSSSSSP